MRKFLIIFPVVVAGLTILMVSGGLVYGATTIDGFEDSLAALLNGLTAYIQGVIDLFTVIAP